MSAALEIARCPLCGRAPYASWDHVVGQPQRFRISCEESLGHWLRVTKRTRADAIREWRRLAGSGR